VPDGRASAFNQAMMELGATVCRPRAPRCPACPVRNGCAGGPDVTAQRRRATRFEDTDRWARGRVVAALLNGEPVPAEIGGERRERVLTGLERDGLVALGPDGAPRLPVR
jgi:A/G-specific adenine glycosylase